MAAFNDLKEDLCRCPVLHAPLPDHPFVVYTDASDMGLAAVLAQKMPEAEHPIFFLSQKLMAPELNYAVVEKEALASTNFGSICGGWRSR